ncbi:MAG: hypothetical protein ACREBU_01160 [Nitrososphaera sp.]
MESVDNDGYHIKHIQVLLNADSITVHAYLMQGVHTTQTFEGTDCYLKFIDFLKRVSPDRKISINAEIIIS